MDALSLLTQRHSQPRLVAPAPSGKVLDNILQAGLRAPDHAGLKPWHFVVCQGQGLVRLGKVFERSAIANGKAQSDIERATKLPLRAPMIIVAINKYTAHPKVPKVEQVSATASAVVAMQMCALAQGFNGMWRTGAYAYCEHVRAEFALQQEDEIIGFLYLGTPACELPSTARTIAVEDFVSHWR